MPQLRQAFQRDLDAIDAMVIELLALIAPDVARATHALLSGQHEGVRVLAEHELIIGLHGAEIEALAKRAVLLQAPVASDFRFLLCVLGILPELERSHHLVAQIATRAEQVRGEDLSPRSRELVEQMGNIASGMWRQTADAWYQHGHSVAAMKDERGDEMGTLHASLMAELSSGRMTLPVTMEMTLVAHFYQRLGDHSASITRQTVCLEGF
jgi:phosphate transport system protein